MAEVYEVRGVPQRIMADGWWLSSAPGAEGGPLRAERSAPARTFSAGRRLAILLLLVLAADLLFYGHRPGLSLALFACALVAAARSDRPDPPCADDMVPAAILVIAALPVVEAVQEVSLAFLVAGTAIAASRAALGPSAPAAVRDRALRLLATLPWVALRASLRAGRETLETDRATLRRLGRAWGFPLVAGGGFVLLLVGANPILSAWISDLAGLTGDLGAGLRRLAFWTGMAAVSWPFVVPGADRVAGQSPRRLPRPPARRFGLNAASVANALGLFNLIFAVQNGLDLAFLWGGADLPEGLTYAEYAHRGAYPLVATALLAGAFALAARPFAAGSAVLTGLLLLWIGQNVLLVLSSIYRLDLYVDAYGLTYLRLHAAVWMALVAAGLGIVAWQVLARRDNGWLLVRTGLLAAAVLYACSFVSFAGVIASTNLAAAREGKGAPLDADHLCRLGIAAAPAIREHVRAGGLDPCGPHVRNSGPIVQGWRDWGFRKERIRRYLSAHPLPAGDPS